MGDGTALLEPDRWTNEPPPNVYDVVCTALPRLTFRTLARADLPPLKKLQDILFPVKYSDAFYEGLFKRSHLTFLAFDCHCDPALVGGRGCPADDRVPGGKCVTHRLVAVATGRLQEEHVVCRKYMDGYITTLGVAPVCRRSGLGHFMLKAIAKLLFAAGCEQVSLHVKEDNEEAIHMYRKAGFMCKERLLNHYLIQGIRYNALYLVLYCSSSKATSWCTIL